MSPYSQTLVPLVRWGKEDKGWQWDTEPDLGRLREIRLIPIETFSMLPPNYDTFVSVGAAECSRHIGRCKKWWDSEDLWHDSIGTDKPVYTVPSLKQYKFPPPVLVKDQIFEFFFNPSLTNKYYACSMFQKSVFHITFLKGIVESYPQNNKQWNVPLSTIKNLRINW